jgi:outer membrane lipoprotein-sorting protein
MKEERENRMKRFKRVGAGVCAAIMLLALASCGTAKNDTAGATPADVLTAAEKKIAEVDSMEAKMTMDMDFSMTEAEQDYDVQTKLDMNMFMFNNPLKMKIEGSMNMTLPGLGEQSMDMAIYMVGEGENYTMYTNQDGSWEAATVDSSFIEQYDPQASMELYLKNAESFTKVAEETINDVKTTKYAGVITGAALEEVINNSGMLDNISGMAMDTEGLDLAALYQNMGDLPISIWIDEEGYPIRYEMDMKDVVNKMFEQILAQPDMAEVGATMTCTKVFVSMDCYNFNQVEDFDVPAEALEAQAS